MPNLLLAQKDDFINKYKTVFETMSRTNSFSTQVKIDVFAQNIPYKAKPIKTVDASMQICNGTYYYKLYRMEYLFTKNLSVLLDHNKRRIIYSKVEQSTDKLFEQFVFKPDSITSNNDSIVIKKNKEGESYFTIYSSKNMISKMDIYFNSNSTFLSKVIYYYNTKFFDTEQSVVLNYSNTKINDNTITPVAINKFIIKKGDNYYPNSNYSSYSVIEAKKI